MSDVRKQIVIAFDQKNNSAYRLAFDTDWFESHLDKKSINKLDKTTRCVTYLERFANPAIPPDFVCGYINFKTEERMEMFFGNLRWGNIDKAISILQQLPPFGVGMVDEVIATLESYQRVQRVTRGFAFLHQVDLSADYIPLSPKEVPTLSYIRDRVNERNLRTTLAVSQAELDFCEPLPEGIALVRS